jgi:pullulanase
MTTHSLLQQVVIAASVLLLCGCGSSVAPQSGMTTLPVIGLSAPTGFAGTESSLYCTVMLSWNASSSAGVTSYSVLRNGSVLGTTTNLTYNDTTAAQSTTYAYSVEATSSTATSIPSTAVSISTGSSCTAAPAFRLGVIYTPNQSTFSIWSPDSSNVALNLNGTLYAMSPMANTSGYTNVYSTTLSGDKYLQTYNFQINRVTSRDPYGVMVQPGTNNDIVLDPSLIALPSSWSATPTLTNRVDSVIYETHVRDFTEDVSSGLPVTDRSTYEGMTMAGTTVNAVAGAPSTGIDHLVDMGITHIQLMPVFDFDACNPSIVATDPACYNWGYDPVNFNIPEERYSQTPNDPTARILEFKTMIDNFHKRGIRVVMDVVYNHTSDETVLGNITPKYYLATDLTGDGNTLDGSQPMVARMIQDSLDYWVSQYHVDGFRFDLMGVFPLTTVQGWATYLTTTYPNNNLLLYGEPYVGIASDPNWPAQIGMSNIGTIASSHIGAFNIAYRGALKNTDDDGGGNTGFMFNQGTADSLFGPYVSGTYFPGTADGLGAISEGILASPLTSLPATLLSTEFPASFTAAPEQSINYVDVHDNLCLADKVSAWAAANGQASNTTLQTTLQQFAMSMILTSQGVPFLYGGSEMQRTKGGNDNSYDAPDSVNDFNWNLLVTNAATYGYVKALIALRKAHPAFRFTSWDAINSNVAADQRSASLVVTQIDASANSDTWKTALVIFNSGAAQSITLPSGTWYVSVAQSTVNTTNPPTATGTIIAASSSITVVYQ